MSDEWTVEKLNRILEKVRADAGCNNCPQDVRDCCHEMCVELYPEFKRALNEAH